MTAIDQGQALATERGRPDLTRRLDNARQRISSRTVTTAIVGEFKRGKSTLVNALIQTAACPVDADIVTAVPTLVKYGARLAVTAYRQQSGEAEVIPVPVDFQDLREMVSEATDDRRTDIRSVEVQVPHRILRSGLCLLDTPGVGGLESVHGQVTLGSLNAVDCVLFVTDASQELTATELEFLHTALDRCPTAAVVVTKTDLHREWRRIAELDRAHLARAGLDLPVIPVSSFLRLRAARAPALNEECGFAPLVEFLAKRVVQQARVHTAATVAHEVDFVASQLARESDAERVVLARPEHRTEVVETLHRANGRARAISAPGAGWQQLLTDGIQDLVADVEHDLQARFRTILHDAREIIDQSDPRDTWTDTGAWLRRQAAAAGVANR
ncbi:MAG TPA: dynamin family protein, partial [Propionicimonas sp.]|nr:dynamin family protein [Propionicimonas sp.]